MLKWLQEHFLEIPKIRLENLKERGSIALVDKETIEEMARSMREEAAASDAEEPPLLRRDRFWEFYEREVEEYYRNRGKKE